MTVPRPVMAFEMHRLRVSDGLIRFHDAPSYRRARSSLTAAKETFMTQGETSYNGQCFCGAVQLEVSGEPAAAGYCHCGSCRSWSAGPVNAFTLWKPESVKVTKGEGDIATFHKSENSHRKWCTKCGGHLMTQHPQWNLIDVYAATIPGFPFKPAVHVHYQETVLRMTDGLPKLKDLPGEMGGSNQPVPE